MPKFSLNFEDKISQTEIYKKLAKICQKIK